jgi:hypothetical protein
MWLMLSCADGTDTDTTDTDTAATPQSVAVASFEATVSDAVRTVVTVSWTTDEPSMGYVAYGNTSDLGWATPMSGEAATEHTAVLVGLTADTEASWQIVVVGGDGSETYEPVQTTTTGPLPVEMPSITVEGDSLGHLIGLPMLGTSTIATVLDGDGNIIWYRTDTRGLDTYRVRPSVDGKGVWFNAASVSGDPAANSQLVWVSWDGTEERTIDVPLLAHDFVEMSDGTIAAIVAEFRGEGDDELHGDSIVEIAPDGTQTKVWDSWDCFDPEVDLDDPFEEGWAFANSLDYDEATETYYLGMRSFSSIAKIPRGMRGCEWVFGTHGATISVAPGEPSFLHQHQFEMLDEDTIVLFDNDGAFGASRALEYDIDVSTNTAVATWDYQPVPSVFTFVLGDVHRYDDGDTLVTFSVSGRMERVTRDLEVVWRADTQIGYAMGFHTVVDSSWRKAP